MTFAALDAWWWPYLFILIAGFAATDFWRFLGVYLGGRISEDSDLLVLVRAVATALVAAVIDLWLGKRAIWRALHQTRAEVQAQ